MDTLASTSGDTLTSVTFCGYYSVGYGEACLLRMVNTCTRLQILELGAYKMLTSRGLYNIGCVLHNTLRVFSVSGNSEITSTAVIAMIKTCCMSNNTTTYTQLERVEFKQCDNVQAIEVTAALKGVIRAENVSVVVV